MKQYQLKQKLNDLRGFLHSVLVVLAGGLADSVVDASEDHLKNGTANGFSFDKISASEFLKTIDRALEQYHETETWQQLMQTGMQRDWSWKSSAQRYLEVYEGAINELNSRV